jgi:uncharacterized membrane protein YtjA (UPF0391 family)
MLRWAFMFFVISLVEGALGFKDARIFFVLAISFFLLLNRGHLRGNGPTRNNGKNTPAVSSSQPPSVVS